MEARTKFSVNGFTYFTDCIFETAYCWKNDIAQAKNTQYQCYKYKAPLKSHQFDLHFFFKKVRWILFHLRRKYCCSDYQLSLWRIEWHLWLNKCSFYSKTYWRNKSTSFFRIFTSNLSFCCHMPYPYRTFHSHDGTPLFFFLNNYILSYILYPTQAVEKFVFCNPSHQFYLNQLKHGPIYNIALWLKQTIYFFCTLTCKSVGKQCKIEPLNL